MIHAKGYAAQSAETDLSPWNFERRDVGPHDILIDIAHHVSEKLDFAAKKLGAHHFVVTKDEEQMNSTN